jgi:hypothetical protein
MPRLLLDAQATMVATCAYRLVWTGFLLLFILFILSKFRLCRYAYYIMERQGCVVLGGTPLLLVRFTCN